MGEVVEPLGAYRRIAIDTSVFIYAFENHPTFSSPATSILQAIYRGDVGGLASIISVMELMIGPYRSQREEIADLYEARLLEFPNLSIRPADMGVARLSASIRARYGFPLPDAIHLATALHGEAETFITNDRALQQFAEIDVTLLSDFIH